MIDYSSNLITSIEQDNPFVTFDTSGNGVSRLDSITWDFTSQKENTKKISFENISDTHRFNIQSYLYAAIQYERDKSSSNHVAVSKVRRWRDNLKVISDIWKKSNFSLLSEKHEWKTFKKDIKGRYSLSALKVMFSTLNTLYDAGVISRYFKYSEVAGLANESITKQHIAMPPLIHAQVLEKISSTINKYHKYRHQISSIMEDIVAIYEIERIKESKKPSVSKHAHSYINMRVNTRIKRLDHDIPDFKFYLDGRWVNKILKDCFISTGLFSGARKNELLSLNPTSYQVKKGIPTLTGLSSKGNEGVPIKTIWTTHPIVKKALELAYDMTEYSRNLHKDSLENALCDGAISRDKYDLSISELNSSFIGLKLNKEIRESYLLDTSKGLNIEDINIMASDEDIEDFEILNPSWEGKLLLNGTLPKFSPHDLRRSFVVFLVRNNLGNLQTVKYQLKHKNINMSDWYANNAAIARMEGVLLDQELFNMVQEESQELAVDVFDDIYNESEVLSGGGCKDLLELKHEALGKGERIVMSRDEIRSLVKAKSLSIVLLPTGGYCTNSSCERLCGLSDFEAEDKPCGHGVVTDKGAKKMARERNELIKSFRELNAMCDYALSSILAGYEEKILVIENTLKSHNINFEPFKERIEVLEP
jgi:integrase